MNSLPFRATRTTRRRALSLAVGAATLAAVAPVRWTAAQVTPIASPVAAPGTPVAGVEVGPSRPVIGSVASDASPQFRAVADALVAAMGQHGVPGAAVGLLAGGREEHATFGLASVSSLEPVTPETLFQIGSITKTFTGTAIWSLIGQGALALDAPVRDYLPELRLMDEAAAAEVTVGNLLDHSAGFYGDEGFDTGDDDDAIARYVRERLPELPQIFPVGEYFSYNNAAFTVLGRLIEVTTGTTYSAALAHLLLAPLGLADTMIDRASVLRRPYADGHVALPINGHPSVAVQTPLWIPRSVDPAGGLWSTTRDLLRYGRFHLGAGTVSGLANVVGPEQLAQMREPAMPVPGTTLQMGRDWFVQDVAGTQVCFHGGDTLGQHADLFIIPGQNFALTVLTNGQGGGSVASAAALDAALAQFPELTPLAGQVGLLPALLAPADAPTVDLSADELAELAGRYADPGQVLSFTQQSDGMEVSAEQIVAPGSWQPAIYPPTAPPAPVAFLDADTGVAAGSRFPFVRDATGRVEWVSAGLRLLPRSAD